MTAKKEKKGIQLLRSAHSHWVGDGFPVRNFFSYDDLAAELSPFLLLDYAGPAYFPPTEERRGVGEHPHRGFETVTVVYAGEVEHRDSTGAGGKIGPGEVQWMTAARGVVHEEFHGREYARKGGDFEIIQLWVNLPRSLKMSEPGYQGLSQDQIPEVVLPLGQGRVRVIAGAFQGARGPAQTKSPIEMWDLRLSAGATLEWELPEGFTTALFVLRGKLESVDQAGQSFQASSAELALFSREGSVLRIRALEESTVLLLSGEPLRDPIVGYGPFVMCTQEEIRQAFQDYQSGKMGRLSH